MWISISAYQMRALMADSTLDPFFVFLLPRITKRLSTYNTKPVTFIWTAINRCLRCSFLDFSLLLLYDACVLSCLSWHSSSSFFFSSLLPVLAFLVCLSILQSAGVFYCLWSFSLQLLDEEIPNMDQTLMLTLPDHLLLLTSLDHLMLLLTPPDHPLLKINTITNYVVNIYQGNG